MRWKGIAVGISRPCQCKGGHVKCITTVVLSCQPQLNPNRQCQKHLANTTTRRRLSTSPCAHNTAHRTGHTTAD